MTGEKSTVPRWYHIRALSEAQLAVIDRALDLYARLRCGQLDELRELCPGLTDHDRFWEAVGALKRVLFHQLGRHASYGIAEGPEQARIAYDLHQVIRHRLAWDRADGGPGCVFDEPVPVSEAGLPKVVSRPDMSHEITDQVVYERVLRALQAGPLTPAQIVKRMPDVDESRLRVVLFELQDLGAVELRTDYRLEARCERLE